MSRYTIDLALEHPDNPVAGDIILSARNAYRVVESRPVDSRVWGNRWLVNREPLGPYDPAAPPSSPPGRPTWHISSYRKGETPVEYFGTPWPPP